MSEDILFYSSLFGCAGLCLYMLIKQSPCLSMPRFSVALLADIYSGACYNISLSETTKNRQLFAGKIDDYKVAGQWRWPCEQGNYYQ